MWAQVINGILGIWLMASPGILMIGGKAADNDHITGPVIATFAITALSECTRGVRRFNRPIGTWLLLAPWILHYSNTIAIFNDMSVGFLVIIFSLFKGRITRQYGGGWTALWK